MAEYIGSRISLISKSDIKYIGTLHEINSESSTVALESVVSYGTEGRKQNPAQEIPGSDVVYEYIVFRGSDVKQLEIVAPPQQQGQENERPKVPDDPAILGSARPQQQIQQPRPPPYHQGPNQFHHAQFAFQPQQQVGGYPPGPPPPNQFPNQPPPRFQGPGGPHGFPGTPGAVPGYGFVSPPPGYRMGYGPPPGHGFPGQPPSPVPFPPYQRMPFDAGMNQPKPPQQQMPSPPQPISNKNVTPQPVNQQAPPPPPPLQAAAQPPASSADPTLSTSASAPPPPPIESKPQVSIPTAPSAPQAQQPATNAAKVAQKVDSRVAVPLHSPHAVAAKPPQKPAAPVPQQSSTAPTITRPQTVHDATQAATAAVAAAMAKLAPVSNSNNKQAQAANTNGSVDNLTQKVNQMRVQDGQQQRGRGRGRAAPYRAGGRRESAQRGVEVPKEDFDFESANAKFNKQDLAKQLPSESPTPTPTNGEAAEPFSNGKAGGDNVEDEDDVLVPSQPAAERRYNKQSSFFDDISSDLKDRAGAEQNIDGRAMRREERSKNMETFGQGSVDGFRGGYRGRGRGRGRGYDRGGGYRGGRGEFRGRGRGRSEQRDLGAV